MKEDCNCPICVQERRLRNLSKIKEAAKALLDEIVKYDYRALKGNSLPYVKARRLAKLVGWKRK